jgi:hypothetical protein
MYRVIFERVVRVFGEGGRGECCRRIFLDALGHFKSGRGGRMGGLYEAEHLRRHLIFPCGVCRGVGEAETPRVPNRGGLFLGPFLCQETGDCLAPFLLDQEGEESRDMFQV